MASEPKKCAHEACSCIAREGQKYCSTFCEDSKGVTTLKCDCDHPKCKGQGL